MVEEKRRFSITNLFRDKLLNSIEKSTTWYSGKRNQSHDDWPNYL